MKEPEIGGPFTVEVVTRDTNDKWKIHERKRPLKGSKRMLVGEELLKDCACNWQRNAVSDFEFGICLPIFMIKGHYVNVNKSIRT